MTIGYYITYITIGYCSASTAGRFRIIRFITGLLTFTKFVEFQESGTVKAYM